MTHLWGFLNLLLQPWFLSALCHSSLELQLFQGGLDLHLQMGRSWWHPLHIWWACTGCCCPRYACLLPPKIGQLHWYSEASWENKLQCWVWGRWCLTWWTGSLLLCPQRRRWGGLGILACGSWSLLSNGEWKLEVGISNQSNLLSMTLRKAWISNTMLRCSSGKHLLGLLFQASHTWWCQKESSPPYH